LYAEVMRKKYIYGNVRFNGSTWTDAQPSRNAIQFLFCGNLGSTTTFASQFMIHCYKTTSISVVISTSGKLSIICCALVDDLSISSSVKTTWNVWIGTVLGAETWVGAQVGTASIRGRVGLWTARSRRARDSGLDRLFWSDKGGSDSGCHCMKGRAHICVQRSPSANTHIPFPSAITRWNPCGSRGKVLK